MIIKYCLKVREFRILTFSPLPPNRSLSHKSYIALISPLSLSRFSSQRLLSLCLSHLSLHRPPLSLTLLHRCPRPPLSLTFSSQPPTASLSLTLLHRSSVDRLLPIHDAVVRKIAGARFVSLSLISLEW